MPTLAESMTEASKAVVNGVRDALNGAVSADPLEVPELENGKATPRAKRKYTKRAPKFFPDGKPPSPAPMPAAEPPGISLKFTPVADKRVRLNLADTFGEEMVIGAGRFPIFAADIIGTIATKGRFQLVDYIPPQRFEAVDKAFKEGVLSALEIECTPMQAWLFTCAGVAGSALVAASLGYAFAMKEQAGKVPKGAADAIRNGLRNGAGGAGGLGGEQLHAPNGVEEVHGQPASVA